MSDSRPDFIGMFRGDPGLSMAAKGPLRSGERMNESSVNAESPAELLERAADRLLALSEDADALPWRFDEDTCQVIDGVSTVAATNISEGHWIAAMNPATALPLANILRGVAFTLSCHPEYVDQNRNYVDLARIILGEQS